MNVFLSAYIITFIIRLFLIEAYQIPSQSMVPSLLIKDILMVEKVSFGTYIPVIGGKLPGIRKPERNDIVVFISPKWESPGKMQELVSLLTLSLINLDNTFDHPKILVKRLIGLPGDTVSMNEQILTINEEAVETEKIMEAKEMVYERLQKVGYLYYDIMEETYRDKKRIVQHLDEEYRIGRNEVYEFGEIRIPVKGDIIRLDDPKLSNFAYRMYQKLIERESGEKLHFVRNEPYLGKEAFEEWKVRQNYYFCMGDNRDLSEDCRFFGLIAENRIFGKPLFRYFPFQRIGFGIDENAADLPKLKILESVE